MKSLYKKIKANGYNKSILNCDINIMELKNNISIETVQHFNSIWGDKILTFRLKNGEPRSKGYVIKANKSNYFFLTHDKVINFIKTLGLKKS